MPSAMKVTMIPARPSAPALLSIAPQDQEAAERADPEPDSEHRDEGHGNPRISDRSV
jgi:hypothetical protein